MPLELTDADRAAIEQARSSVPMPRTNYADDELQELFAEAKKHGTTMREAVYLAGMRAMAERCAQMADAMMRRNGREIAAAIRSLIADAFESPPR